MYIQYAAAAAYLVFSFSRAQCTAYTQLVPTNKVDKSQYAAAAAYCIYSAKCLKAILSNQYAAAAYYLVYTYYVLTIPGQFAGAS